MVAFLIVSGILAYLFGVGATGWYFDDCEEGWIAAFCWPLSLPVALSFRLTKDFAARRSVNVPRAQVVKGGS